MNIQNVLSSSGSNAGVVDTSVPLVMQWHGQ